MPKIQKYLKFEQVIVEIPDLEYSDFWFSDVFSFKIQSVIPDFGRHSKSELFSCSSCKEAVVTLQAVIG